MADSNGLQALMAGGGPPQPDALGENDFRQLVDLQNAKDPRAHQLLKTLSPQEMKAFLDYSVQQGGGVKDTGPIGPMGAFNPAFAGLGSVEAAAPGVAKASGGLGGMVRAGIDMMPGIPKWAKMLGKLGDLRNGAEEAVVGKPPTAVPPAEPPMSDAAYEAAAGHPRYGSPGAPTHLRTPSSAASKPSIGGIDTAGLRDQPNVSTTRTPGDVMEQVTGSSRNGWEDSRNMEPGYGPESDPEVEQVQARIRSQLKKPRVK